MAKIANRTNETEVREVAPENTGDNLKDAMQKMNQLVQKSAREKQSSKRLTSLGAYIEKRWQIAKDAKQGIQQSLYESALQRKGEYTQDKLSKIKKFKGSTVFMNLTSNKCRAAEAWIRDILGPEIWAIDPTPIPDLPPHVQQFIQQMVREQFQKNPMLIETIDNPKEMFDEIYKNTHEAMKKQAKLTASRMEIKIKDQLVEARWRKTLEEVISDVVTYKAGIIKGPVVRRKLSLGWQQNEQSGTWQAVQGDNIIVEYDRVSPFDFYPISSMGSIENMDVFQRHRLFRKNLAALLGVPGYDEESIRLVLSEYADGGLKEWLWEDQLKEEAEGEDEERNKVHLDTIDALEFWGSCQGQKLIDWGLEDPRIADPHKEYQVSVWKIGSYIIKAMINEHPTGQKPYKMTSFELLPGSIWGHGVPELMADIQQMCNAAARDLVNNLGISSGPQVVIDTEQLDSDTNEEEMYPWKIWLVDSSGNRRPSAIKPIDFFQPDSNAGELMAVYDRFEKKAEDYTGIPSYVAGSGGVGSAGSTATGFAMLQSNATRSIKSVLLNISTDIVEPSVFNLYVFNMLFDPDESIKGDLKVNVRGMLALMQKEQLTLRKTEFLSMLSTNPLYLEIIGMKGLSNLLRDVTSTLEMPDVIPSENEIEAKELQKDQFLQLQQAYEAMLNGQLSPEQLLEILGQMFGIKQEGQQQSEQVNKGTPPKKTETTPTGTKLGGAEANLFANRSGR